MNRFAFEQPWLLLENYYQNKRKCREGPSVYRIRKFIVKVRETGFIVHTPRREKARTVRTPENIEAAAEGVHENPSPSARHCSQELNISLTSVCGIL